MRGRTPRAACRPMMCLSSRQCCGAREAGGVKIAVVEVAGDEMALHIGELRLMLCASLHRVRAARVKAAAGGRAQRARTLAGENDLFAALVGVSRQSRREQRLGIRV